MGAWNARLQFVIFNSRNTRFGIFARFRIEHRIFSSSFEGGLPWPSQRNWSMRMEKCSWCAPLNPEVSDSSTELVERLGSLQGFYELVHGRRVQGGGEEDDFGARIGRSERIIRVRANLENRRTRSEEKSFVNDYSDRPAKISRAMLSSSLG